MPQDFTLFEDLSFTSADSGKILSATASNDPDFNNIVTRLTNGIKDDVFFYTTIDSGFAGTTTSEANAFSLRTVDFKKFEINSIDLVISSLTIVSPGEDPNGDGIWTDSIYDVEIVINGEAKPIIVPEPTSTSASPSA